MVHRKDDDATTPHAPHNRRRPHRSLDELDADEAIDTSEFARMIGQSPITVAQSRARGEGPPFFRVGRRTVRYRLGTVREWIADRTVGKVAK